MGILGFFHGEDQREEERFLHAFTGISASWEKDAGTYRLHFHYSSLPPLYRLLGLELAIVIGDPETLISAHLEWSRDSQSARLLTPEPMSATDPPKAVVISDGRLCRRVAIR